MSDTTQAEVTEAPKPKRKYVRRAKPKAEAKPAAVKVDLWAGITERDCCTKCYADGGICALTGGRICAHPVFGGDRQNPKGRANIELARRFLKHAALDKKLAG